MIKFSPSDPFADPSERFVDDDALPEDWHLLGSEDDLDPFADMLEGDSIEDVLHELTGGSRADD